MRVAPKAGRQEREVDNRGVKRDSLLSRNCPTRPEAAEALRAGLLDLSTVRAFLQGARDPEGREFLPSMEALGADSARVVHLQVTHALALQRALDHGAELALPANVQRLTPVLARDLFDADYLMLGVLQGGLATREKRLRRIFAWLRPEGILFPEPPATEDESRG